MDAMLIISAVVAFIAGSGITFALIAGFAQDVAETLRYRRAEREHARTIAHHRRMIEIERFR